MAKVLLGVTGSVAAIKTPELFDRLSQAGHDVRIVATRAAPYFFDTSRFGGPPTLNLDEHEWPGEAYRRGDPVLHIELRRWADLFLIAPLDANTLAKLAVGLCDNCLTCVWRAWEPGRPVALAPAMNTLMWEHPFTLRHLRSLAVDFGAAHIPGHLDAATVIETINERSPALRIIPPITKTLACGDDGVGAMAEVETIVDSVAEMFN